MLKRLNILNFFEPNRTLDPALRTLFFHLYWDVAWFGLLAGSSMAFITVYATRIGASSLQIGLITAGPAIINLLFTLPAGRWLQGRPIGHAVVNTIILHRLPYLLWIILPALLPQSMQIWAYIGLIALMTIPGTAVAVGFNALFAAAVPVEWRAHVVGIRNAVLAVTTVVIGLICGVILNTLPSPLGYQIVFALGLIGAAMSTVHIWYLRHVSAESHEESVQVQEYIGDQARPGTMRLGSGTVRMSIALRVFTLSKNMLRSEVLRGSYGQVIAALFFFHFTQFLPVALFPLRWIQNLHFSDFEISVATATFQLAVLLGSLQFSRVTQKLGYQRSIVVGIVLLSVYPLINAFMANLALFMIASLIGGAGWSLLGGSIANFVLDKTPADDRPAYLAWYNLALNAGILAGSMVGPLLADQLGLTMALVLSAVLRLSSAYAVWKVR